MASPTGAAQNAVEVDVGFMPPPPPSEETEPTSTLSATDNAVVLAVATTTSTIKTVDSFGIATPRPLRRATLGAKQVALSKKKLRRSQIGLVHLFSSQERAWKTIIGGTMALCLVWIAITTFAPEPTGLLRANGTLCPRETVCAENWYSIALLAISRSSAYFTYPLMMLLFVSKTNHLRTILQNSYLSLYVPFHDLHGLHVYAGRVVGTDVTIHTVCHILRWALQGNISLLWRHVTGRSGFLSILVTPLIVLPMAHPKLRKKISWEARKALHYLSIVWGVSICFHAPLMHIAYIMGFPVALYLADYVIGSFFRTFHISSSEFVHLECGVELTFEHPRGFCSNGTGYVLVCLPWISRAQWHAFSLFAHPTRPNHSCVCMNKGGDWTRELHKAVQHPTSRPAWISGPFASPYSTAVEFDHLILVASGIGITPAMSIITTFKETRRTNLIWACRDAALLEFYLEKCKFDHQSWTLIYYTGKRKLALSSDLPPTVLIFNGRPNLDGAVRNMILGVEKGTALPEQLYDEAEAAIAEARAFNDLLSIDGLSASQRFDALIRRSLVTYGEERLRERLGGFFTAPELDAAALFEVLNTFFEDGMFSMSDMPELISRFDKDRNGKVNVSELLGQSDTRMGDATVRNLKPTSRKVSMAMRTFSPAQKRNKKDKLGVEASLHKPKRFSQAFAQDLNDPDSFVDFIGADRLANWQMLYCGGSQPVVDALKTIEVAYGISLRVEKFDW